MAPDWPLQGDKVTLTDGTVGEITTGELVNPLGSDELCDLCVQWPASGAGKWSRWLFCEPGDLVRDGDGWKLKA